MTMAPAKKKQKKKKGSQMAAAPAETRWMQLDIRRAFGPPTRPKNRLAILPDDFLRGTIFSFLESNDLSNLSLTSGEMLRKVSSTREYPCILREECPEIIIAYRSWEFVPRLTFYSVNLSTFYSRTR
jgi:hypothetical protein